MADVTPLKRNLQVEELRTGAAASESTMQRVASSVNFWNTFYEGTRAWFFNGQYGDFPFPQTGVDGVYNVPCDMEIYQLAVNHNTAGISGTFEIDLIKIPVGGGPEVSVFATRPQIPFGAGNFAVIHQEFLPTASTIVASPGVTLATLVSTQLSKGDRLYTNIIGGQIQGQSAGLVLMMRPR
jgi:hypothetical protein